MFKAKLANAGLLKKIVESIKGLVSDAPFDCSETAIRLQVMDSSQVALVSLKLEAGLFDTYRCDETVNFGLSLANLSNALKCADNEDQCMLKYEENNDSIEFTFADPKSEKTQDVTLRLIDIRSNHIGIQERHYSVVCEMSAGQFQKTCKDLTTFSETLNITASKTGIIFTGKGDIGSSIVTFPPSSNTHDEKTVYLEVKEPVNARFSIKYMNQFTKATTLSDRVRLKLSNNAPVVVEYPIEGNGYLRFYLSAKIDDDENMD